MRYPANYLHLLPVLMFLMAGPAQAVDFWTWINFDRMKGVEPVADTAYQEECSACHFAYQPGLLPSSAWRVLLSGAGLADHFGENAELDELVRQRLEDYAVAHAAETSLYKRSRKIISSIGAAPSPLQITLVPYIKRKHQELPARYIRDNAEVNSLSNCNSCHTQAAEGVYDDDTVEIPGYGRWND